MTGLTELYIFYIISQSFATVGIYQGVVSTEDVVDNAGTISTRYSMNDYRFRSDGLVGNVHSSSSVVGGSGGLTGTGSGGMASSSSSIISDVPHSPTPPLQRRLAKSFSVAPSSNQNKGALSFCIFSSSLSFVYFNFTSVVCILLYTCRVRDSYTESFRLHSHIHTNKRAHIFLLEFHFVSALETI